MDTDATEPTPEMPEGEEPPPKGVRAMAVVRWILLAVAVLVAAGSWWSFARAQHHDAPVQTTKYHCPMHPQIVSDQPGECPICHMTLEPFTPEPAPVPSAPQPSASASPSASAPTPTRAAHTAMGHVDASAPTDMEPPPGTAPLDLALDRVQSIGVRTALATERESSSPIRVTATIVAPEQSRAEVHVRANGFVERINVAQTGISIGRGQLLFSIYSPEIFQGENELLAARKWAGDAGRSETLEAARRKLALLGMDDRDVARVEATGEPTRAIGVYAPMGGFVTRKSVVQGSYVTPEMALFEIQDLSRVWIVADVLQPDIRAIGVGTTGAFSLTRAPEQKTTARVDLVYPAVNDQARTTRVRMPTANDAMKLRPGDYGTVEFSTAARKRIFVPRDAIVDTGKSTYVFIVEREGRYVPRSVVLGEAEGDQLAIDAGVAPGERVVSGATFLIDAESRLRASLAPASTGADGGAAAPQSECDTLVDRAKYPDKWTECQKCEAHRGMGSMLDDCRNAIPKPWR